MIFLYPEGYRFVGDEIDVIIEKLTPPDFSKGWVPAYECKVVQHGETMKIGNINIRVGYTDSLVKFGGHIGYSIDEAYRGHHYAAKACELIKPIFQGHGMDVIWITCNPDNWPSRKTCERLGCPLVEIVDLPEDNDQYQEGERHKCRYRWMIY